MTPDWLGYFTNVKELITIDAIRFSEGDKRFFDSIKGRDYYLGYEIHHKRHILLGEGLKDFLTT
jgi:hypothetical protein